MNKNVKGVRKVYNRKIIRNKIRQKYTNKAVRNVWIAIKDSAKGLI